MDVSSIDRFNKDLCELKHASIQKEIDEQKHISAELKEEISEITHPATGHIYILRSELLNKIERLESRLNGLIISIITTAVGIAIAIGSEFIKRFVK